MKRIRGVWSCGGCTLNIKRQLNARAIDSEFVCLDGVMSINEASELYGKHRKTIIYHIDRGHIAYRVMDDTYILSKESLDRLFKKGVQNGSLVG